MAVIVFLAIWLGASVPVSLGLGVLLRASASPELIGMEGSEALFRRPDGTLCRVELDEYLHHVG